MWWFPTGKLSLILSDLDSPMRLNYLMPFTDAWQSSNYEVMKLWPLLPGSITASLYSNDLCSFPKRYFFTVCSTQGGTPCPPMLFPAYADWTQVIDAKSWSLSLANMKRIRMDFYRFLQIFTDFYLDIRCLKILNTD